MGNIIYNRKTRIYLQDDNDSDDNVSSALAGDQRTNKKKKRMRVRDMEELVIGMQQGIIQDLKSTYRDHAVRLKMITDELDAAKNELAELRDVINGDGVIRRPKVPDKPVAIAPQTEVKVQARAEDVPLEEDNGEEEEIVEHEAQGTEVPPPPENDDEELTMAERAALKQQLD